MVDPFNVSSVQHVPVADELSRLGINLSVPRGRLTLPAVVRRRTGLTDAPLTLEQSLALRQVQGHAVRAALEQVMRSRTYRTMSDLARESVVRSTVTRVSTRVRNQARHELMQMSAPRR